MPPLGEQRAIADYLDTETARIDALITKKRRLITLLEERWVVHRQKVLLGTLDPVSAYWLCTIRLVGCSESWRSHRAATRTRSSGRSTTTLGRFRSLVQEVRRDFTKSRAVPGPGVVTGRYGTIGRGLLRCGRLLASQHNLVREGFSRERPAMASITCSQPFLWMRKRTKSAVTGINRRCRGATESAPPFGGRAAAT